MWSFAGFVGTPLFMTKMMLSCSSRSCGRVPSWFSYWDRFRVRYFWYTLFFILYAFVFLLLGRVGLWVWVFVVVVWVILCGCVFVCVCVCVYNMGGGGGGRGNQWGVCCVICLFSGMGGGRCYSSIWHGRMFLIYMLECFRGVSNMVWCVLHGRY